MDIDQKITHPVFMLDRDQVFYSKAFRRLAGKAQVYIADVDDHKRTRLTHTLEVSQIARSIAQALDLDVDLVEAISLAHDLGHTPFGHAGERILHEIMTPQKKHMLGNSCPLGLEKYEDGFPAKLERFLGFKHNLQSLVVAMDLEKNNADRGLDLTAFTLYGVQAHSGNRYKKGRVSNHDKLGYYDAYLDRGCKLTDGSWAWSLEALLVAQADEIAQYHHDMEDALMGGLITPEELVSMIRTHFGEPEEIFCLDEQEKQILENPGQQDLDLFIALFSRSLVKLLMDRLAETAQENIRRIGRSESVPVPGSHPGLYSKKAHVYIGADEETEKQIQDIFSYRVPGGDDSFAKAVKAFSGEILPRVLSSHDIQTADAKGQYIIRKIFQAYYTTPQQLPDHCVYEFFASYRALWADESLKAYCRPEFQDQSEAQLRKLAAARGVGSVRQRFSRMFQDREQTTAVEELLLMRVICNHIACMTDSYAQKTYQTLYS